MERGIGSARESGHVFTRKCRELLPRKPVEILPEHDPDSISARIVDSDGRKVPAFPTF
jgi:hypothetical protein